MADFFDPTGPGAGLQNFGFATMAAGGVPGATTIGALGQGGLAMQQGQGQRIANQTAMLNLQRMQALQPMMLQKIQSMQGGGQPASNGTPTSTPSGGQSAGQSSGSTGGSTGSNPDDLAAQTLNWAYMSGNAEQISKAYQSLYEHNPEQARQIKAAQEGETIQKTANDTFAKGKDLVGGAGMTSSPSLGNPSMPTQVQRPSKNNTPQQASQPDSQPDEATPQQMLATDGKPVLPNRKGMKGIDLNAQPDPAGTPKYRYDNNAVGVAQAKQFVADDAKSNQSMNASLSSLQSEQFRLEELGKIYKQVQAGTLTAQKPEFFNKMAALGFNDSPNDIKDLDGIQAAMQNHILQLINQYKDTNSSMGEAPTRMFGGVLNTLMEEGENPGNQPGGLYSVITQAKGLVDHHIDMVNGWNNIGALGNRVANGYTMRPDDYVRNWSLNHDIEDYKSKAETDMPKFKGMQSDIQRPTSIPDGAQFSPSQKKWRVPKQGGGHDFYDSDGKQIM